LLNNSANRIIVGDRGVDDRGATRARPRARVVRRAAARTAPSRRRAVESYVCSVFHPGFGIEYLSSANSIDVGAIFRI
jgi:hypothetical protein